MGFGFTSGRAFFTAIANPHFAHCREIDYIIAYECGFGGGDSIFRKYLREYCGLVLNPLMHVSIFKSRARRATVSEMRLVMIPDLMPAAEPTIIAVPSWAWKPLASISLALWSPKPPCRSF